MGGGGGGLKCWAEKKQNKLNFGNWEGSHGRKKERAK